MKNNPTYIFGRNAVLEALRSGAVIEKIFIAFGTHGDSVSSIFAKAKNLKIPCVTVDKQKFAFMEKSFCPPNTKSQGVIALIEQVETLNLNEIIAHSYKNSEKPILIALDEISDPHNLGAIARSTECSGANGIILTVKNSSPLTPVAIKTSAGALDYLPVCKVSSMSQTLDKLKEEGFWIIGTEMNADHDYTENIYDSPIVIIIGSEGKGLRPSTLKQCDFLVKIPMKGKIESLNASVSAGVILFEIARQRRK